MFKMQLNTKLSGAKEVPQSDLREGTILRNRPTKVRIPQGNAGELDHSERTELETVLVAENINVFLIL